MILKQTGTGLAAAVAAFLATFGAASAQDVKIGYCRCAERAGVVHRARHQARRRDGDRRDQRQGRG